LHSGCGGAEIGARLVKALQGRGARRSQLLGSSQIEFGAISGGSGVGEVGFRLGNFGLLAPRL